MQKKVTYSVIVAILVFFLSMFLAFIPCQTAPEVPNPTYKWSLCDLNPDNNQTGKIIQYFGYTERITDSYFITIALTFIVAMIILHFVARTKQ